MITTAPLMSADDLATRLGTDAAPFLIDVREPEEHAEWRINGSCNIPLGELAARAREIPRDRTVVVYCAAGGRSAAAGRVLVEAGLDVHDLAGGMQSWAGVYDTAEHVTGTATIVQVRRRAKGCLSYVVGAGDECFVVDPSLDVDRYTDIAAANGWRITRVFDTHLHADHLSGARELAARAGATLHLNPHDDFAFDYTPIGDGQSFRLAGTVEVSIASLHTPGHTRGSTTLLIDGVVALTGDVLFVDGVGRPDLAARAAEFARTLHRSLHESVLALPDDTFVLPAHHGDAVVPRPGVPVGATLGELRRSVPQLGMEERAFVEWCVTRTTPTPPNFVDIVTANAGRGPQPRSLAHLEAGPNRCSA